MKGRYIAPINWSCTGIYLFRCPIYPHPASSLSLARFWRTLERLCMKRVISLLSICGMLLGYSLESRPNSHALEYTKQDWLIQTFESYSDLKGLTRFRQSLPFSYSLQETILRSIRRVVYPTNKEWKWFHHLGLDDAKHHFPFFSRNCNGYNTSLDIYAVLGEIALLNSLVLQPN